MSLENFRITAPIETISSEVEVLSAELNTIVLPIIDSISQLLQTDFRLRPTINLIGFYSANDMPAGALYYDSESTLVHDGGRVISPLAPIPATRSELSAYLRFSTSESGRWIRTVKPSDPIPIEWYGEISPQDTDDSSIPINVAIQSPHNEYYVIQLNIQMYTLYNRIAFLNTNYYRTLRGKGNGTKLVGAKPITMPALIYIPPRCHDISLELFKIQAWDYPAEYEPGWTDRYKYSSDGKYRFADQVQTVAPVNGVEEYRTIVRSNPLNQTLFPSFVYDHTTIELVVVGTVDSISTPFTINISQGQISNIQVILSVPTTPDDFNLYTYAPLVRIIRQGSSSTSGFFNLPPISNALLPYQYASDQGATARMRCDVQYNYNKTFTLTFSFNSPVNLSTLTASSYYNTLTQIYTLPMTLNLYRRSYNLILDGLTLDGLYFTGGDPIGYSNCLTLHAVHNVVVRNCSFKNVDNDGISMKQQFDSWGPTIQTNSLNQYTSVQNCTFDNMATSGVDFEGDYVIVENNRFTNIWGNGAVRLGSRGYGTLIRQNIVRNNFLAFSTGIQSGQANITIRCLGDCTMKQFIASECELVNSFTDAEDIRIQLTDSIEYVKIEKCIFKQFWRAIQAQATLNRVVVNDCAFSNHRLNGAAKVVYYNTSASSLVGQVHFMDNTIERNDTVAISLISGTLPTDYSPEYEVSNLLLTATPLYSRAIINSKYYRTNVMGNISSFTSNINLTLQSFTAAALPSPTTQQLIFVRSDTNGNPTSIVAYSNGTNWYRIDNNVQLPS